MPVRPLEVRQREDVKELGAWSGTEGVEALSALKLIRAHNDSSLRPVRTRRSPLIRVPLVSHFSREWHRREPDGGHREEEDGRPAKRA